MTYKYLLKMYDSVFCVGLKEKLTTYINLKRLKYKILIKTFQKIIYIYIFKKKNNEVYEYIMNLEKVNFNLMIRGNVDCLDIFYDTFEFIEKAKEEYGI